MNPSGTSETYLLSGAVRRRYGGISDMSLWRWLRDDKLNFPKPIVINGRRYWRRSDLEAFDSRLGIEQAVA